MTASALLAAVIEQTLADIFPNRVRFVYPEELAAYMNVTKDKSSLTKTV
jgi:hypothetical protein